MSNTSHYARYIHISVLSTYKIVSLIVLWLNVGDTNGADDVFGLTNENMLKTKTLNSNRMVVLFCLHGVNIDTHHNCTYSFGRIAQ